MNLETTSRLEPAPQGLRSRNPSLVFVVQAAAWVLLLFALVRVPWVQQNLLLPFAVLQGRVACALAGTAPNSVFVGLSCTGADPMALILGAVLAFPVAWSRRLRGAALGLGLILVLNTARIGTLSLVVRQRELFNLLHVYIWPAVLILAAASYVFVWMGSSLRDPTAARRPQAVEAPFSRQRTLRFVGLTTLLVIAFFLLSPWLMTSAAVLEVARWATLAAAAVMTAIGVPVEIAGNTLRTGSGAWVVTQACVATPLLPIYLAAVAFLPTTAFRRFLAALGALPLFLFLGSARLLVLALPAAVVGSHATAVHAFYQILTAALVVVWIALRGSRPGLTALRALSVGAACAYLAGWPARAWLWPAAERLADSLHLGHAWVDPQGVLALMLPFQFGLFVALWLALRRPIRDRRLAIGLALLGLGQLVAAVFLGELAVHAGLEFPVTALRAASLALPMAILWWDALVRPAPAAPPVATETVR